MRLATKGSIAKLLNGRHYTEKELVALLEKAGYVIIENDSVDVRTTSIKVKAVDGLSFVRIYENGRKELVIQEWGLPIKMKFSGVPVFNPSRYL